MTLLNKMADGSANERRAVYDRLGGAGSALPREGRSAEMMKDQQWLDTGSGVELQPPPPSQGDVHKRLGGAVQVSGLWRGGVETGLPSWLPRSTFIDHPVDLVLETCIALWDSILVFLSIYSGGVLYRV